MIIVTHESMAVKLFEKYPQAVVFGLGKNKGLTLTDGSKVNYTDPIVLPKNDYINSVADGSTSMKKAAKEIEHVVRSMIYKPLSGYTHVATTSSVVARIANDSNKKKRIPIILYVFDDVNKDNLTKEELGMVRRREEFIVAYLKRLYKLYGLKVITDEKIKKIYKKIFKVKGKKERKRILKIRDKIADYNEANCMTDTGTAFLTLVTHMYNYELNFSTLEDVLTDIRDANESVEDFWDERPRNHIKAMARYYTSAVSADVYEMVDMLNLFEPEKDTKKAKKKAAKKYKKFLHQYRARVKNAYEDYMMIRDILSEAGMAELPKAKFSVEKDKKGYPKRKKGKMIPKMDPKKFVKKGSKVAQFMAIPMAHTAITRFTGNEPGTKEYMIHMKNFLNLAGFSNDVAKAIIASILNELTDDDKTSVAKKDSTKKDNK